MLNKFLFLCSVMSLATIGLHATECNMIEEPAVKVEQNAKVEIVEEQEQTTILACDEAVEETKQEETKEVAACGCNRDKNKNLAGCPCNKKDKNKNLAGCNCARNKDKNKNLACNLDEKTEELTEKAAEAVLV